MITSLSGLLAMIVYVVQLTEHEHINVSARPPSV